jgi:hypothetical protein
MMSLAKSRYTLPAQFVFLGANALGVVPAILYNAQTPDLYPNNAHHKVGWIITAVVAAQVLVGLVAHLGGAFHGQAQARRSRAEEHRFVPLETCDSASQGCLSGGSSRMSHDSAQRLRPTVVGSARDHSGEEDSLAMHHRRKEDIAGDNSGFEDMLLSAAASRGRFASKAIRVFSSSVWKPLAIGYQIIDRIILTFGFVAFVTGIGTYGRFFVRPSPAPRIRVQTLTILSLVGGSRYLWWFGALDQERSILLARPFQPQPMVWELR